MSEIIDEFYPLQKEKITNESAAVTSKLRKGFDPAKSNFA